MPTATLTPDRIRTFGAGADELAHPVDVLGRARFRASIDMSSVHVARSADPTAAIPFVGTAILFNTRTWIGSRDYGFWEQIAPEAVTKTLLEADVRLLQNHNPDLLLARTNPRMRGEDQATLVLEATPAGVRTAADMAPTSYAQDLAILLDRGDISQMSFAFDPISWTREQLADGTMLITITELRLYDVSIVTYPAYEETDAGLRAAAFDAMCRSAGVDPSTVLRTYLDGGPLMTTPTVSRAVGPSAPIKRAFVAGETRDLNGWTFGDLWDLLDAAVVEQHSTDEFNAYWYVGVYDVSDTWLVYWQRLPGNPQTTWWQCDYSVDVEGKVTLGDSVEVVAKTTYLAVATGEPVPDGSAGDGEPATEMSAAMGGLSARTVALRHAMTVADLADPEGAAEIAGAG